MALNANGLTNLSYLPASALLILTLPNQDVQYSFNFGPDLTSTLPTAAVAGAGALSMVSDATATTNGSTLVGGGTNVVLVKSNGTNWIILG
jgi:hypothetical protein